MTEKEEFRYICEEMVKVLTMTDEYMKDTYHYEIPKFQGDFDEYKPQLKKHLEAIDLEINYLKNRINKLELLLLLIEDENGLHEDAIVSFEKLIVEITDKRNKFAQKCEDYFQVKDGYEITYSPEKGMTVTYLEKPDPAPKKKPVKPLVQKLISQKQYPIPTPPKKRTIIENIIRHARIIFEQLFRRTFTF